MSGGVIAIDGPSASGKSSTARAVAEALGFAHLDSGSLYRGVTVVALREKTLNPEHFLRAAEDRGLMLQSDGVGFAAYLDGEPAEDALRTAEVTAQVSAVAAMPVVREWVNSRLRAMVRAGQNVVVDGRDIGTVVFPDANLKIFLTASPEARAGRRISQRGMAVRPEHLDAETQALAARDHADSTRQVAPLKPAHDAVHLDTTTMDFADQVRFIVDRARQIFSRS
jgi:cytidylate kinase